MICCFTTETDGLVNAGYWSVSGHCMFLLDQKSPKAKVFVGFMKNEEKMEIGAFLADVASHLSDLHVKLQGRNNTSCDLVSTVCAFQRKLVVFSCDKKFTFPKLLEHTARRYHQLDHAELLDKLFSSELCPNSQSRPITSVPSNRTPRPPRSRPLQEAHCDPVTFWT